MWRRPESAADDPVCVTDRRPVGRGIRRLAPAPAQRDAERQVVLDLSFEQPILRGFEKALRVGMPLDSERGARTTRPRG